MSGIDRTLSSLVSVVRRRSLPGLATLTTAIAGAIVYLIYTPAVYEVKGRLILDEKQVSVSELGRDLSELSSHTPGGSSPLATQAELIKSTTVLKQTLAEVFPKDPESDPLQPTVKDLKKNLKIKLIPATNILELRYENEKPAMATELLNTLLKIVVEKSTDAIRLEAKSVRKFLEKSVPQQRAKAEAAEVALNQYRQASGLVAVQEQTENLVKSIAEIEKEESLVAAQLQEASRRFKALQEVGELNEIENAYAGGRIGQDRQLGELRDRLVQVESELANRRSQFTDRHPAVILLLEERDKLQQLYDRQLTQVVSGDREVSPRDITTDKLSQDLTDKYLLTQTERLALEQKLNALYAKRIQLQKRLDRFPIQEQPLAALVRERDEAVESLKFLQNKLEEARIAEAQLVSNIRIIEQAQIPRLPSGPNKKVVLVLAIAAGMLLGTGVAGVLEVLDNTLYEAEEAEDLLDLPMLGVLPELRVRAGKLERPSAFLDNLQAVEAYRRLLKKLEYRTQEQLLPLVVTSSVPEEGKSIVAAHLAAVSAMLSRRTLIVDADLHQPSQHRLFDVSPALGLTDAIAHNLSLLEVVQPTEIENLWVLSCGERRSHPSASIESPAMQSLLREAAAQYDVIVVDTPPASECADAQALSQHSHGTIAIARLQYTQKEILRRTVSELKENGAPMLGFVLNRMTAKTAKTYRQALESDRPKKPPKVRDISGTDPLQPPATSWKSVASPGVENGKS